MTDYHDFLRRKQRTTIRSGFEVSADAIHPMLFDWQREIVRWALNLGRAAIFAERGLGKTIMQVEWSKHVHEHTGAPLLIVCPLAVAHQTIAEAARIGVPVAYVRSQADVEAAPSPIVITNYDRLIRDTFDTSYFGGLVLDESSSLKHFTSKTRQYLTNQFAGIPYKLACTATPSPNDTVELGNHSEFLGVMNSGDMLTQWFIRDSEHANNLRLKGHAVKDFWRWVTTWPVCLNTPADMGYPDDRYNLPPLHLHYERVDVDHRRAWQAPDDGQLPMFVDTVNSATNVWREKHETLGARIARVEQLAREHPDEPLIIWHETNYERDAIAEAVPEALIVSGEMEPEEKEELLNAFTVGQARIIATKPRIGGWGLNWQHCARPIFASVTHKFEELYQALGRNHRFGQERPVHAHLVYAESEQSIIASLEEKWRKHDEMKREMVAAMSEFGLAAEHKRGGAGQGLDRRVATGRDWELRLGDAVEEIRVLPDRSVGLSVSSWPFSDQYTYTDSPHDLSNCDGDGEFFAQMDYLIPHLLRVTVPGRLAIVHAKDRIVYGTKSEYGTMYIEPFSDKCVQAMCKHGWLFFGRVTISTDVVFENRQTHRLTEKELRKDASRMGVGMPEYALLFRKPPAGEGTWSDQRVIVSPDKYSLARWQIDANSLWRSNGDRLLFPWEADGAYDYAAHVAHLEDLDRKGALYKAHMTEPLPSDNNWVWWDIQRTNTLNGVLARDHADEKHICPLQLDVVERCIARWSNPGDTVLDYFAGVGSVPYTAVLQGRKGIGIELKPCYFDWACRFVEDAERRAHTLTLFDWVELQQNQEVR